jgi:uncharacterized protein (DUF983 family)
MSKLIMGNDGQPSTGALKGILRKRCPRCRSGQVYRALWKMNANCPVCGLVFGRGDPGYFTGAMYVSYAIAIPLLGLVILALYLLLPSWSLYRLGMLASILCTPSIPLIWQYSRVLWIYFDRYFDPEDEASETQTDREGP